MRAVAIALVMVAHAGPSSGLASSVAADAGVRIFFVLSGFLITTLLVRESDAHGSISLTRFYLRRAFRIFPAFYTYLLVVGVLTIAGVMELRDGDMRSAATYTMNFHADRSWFVGHLWSLSVEEQFYILWPLILVVATRSRASSLAFAAVVLAPVIRVACWRWLPAQRALADQALPCVFDALASGCLLALAMPRLSRSETCARFLDSRWFWLVPVVGLLGMATRNPLLSYGPGMSIANFSIALVILRCIARPTTGFAKYLEAPALVWVGALSYSLYLWQQLFVNRHADQWINHFPVSVVLAFGAAVLCHYAIERPCLRLNERLRPVALAPRAPEITVMAPGCVVMDVSHRSHRPPTRTLPPPMRATDLHAQEPE